MKPDQIDHLSRAHRVRIWDGWIRIFHWSLAIAILFLLVSGETAWQFYEWHRYVGECVVLLIVFRLAWSIVGSANASLVGLIVSPLKVFQHLRDLVRGSASPHRGHNAAGGWAVLLMLTAVAVQALSGLFIADEEELIEGAFYASVSTETSDFLYSVHHWNADLIQVLVALHVIMIGVYALRLGQNLLTPMITGWMAWPATDTDGPPAEPGFQRAGVGLLVLVVAAAIISWAFNWW